MIIAPFWPRPAFAVRKMSPGAAAGELVVTATEGGCSVGSETKLWLAPGLAAGGVRPAGSGKLTSRAIVKLVPTRAAWPRAPTTADTVTRSPSEKPRAGRKLAPAALAYERSSPLCDPLREPFTETSEICPAGTPRKLIWVCGEASGVPFSGDNVTACAPAAVTPSASPATRSASALTRPRSTRFWIRTVLLAGDAHVCPTRP